MGSVTLPAPRSSTTPTPAGRMPPRSQELRSARSESTEREPGQSVSAEWRTRRDPGRPTAPGRMPGAAVSGDPARIRERPFEHRSRHSPSAAFTHRLSADGAARCSRQRRYGRGKRAGSDGLHHCGPPWGTRVPFDGACATTRGLTRQQPLLRRCSGLGTQWRDRAGISPGFRTPSLDAEKVPRGTSLRPGPMGALLITLMTAHASVRESCCGRCPGLSWATREHRVRGRSHAHEEGGKCGGFPPPAT